MNSLWGISVVAIGFSAFATGHAHAQAGLSLLPVDLPDGTTWKLGEGGIGRPFKVRLLLKNESKTPLMIWDYKNSEGAQCPGVILTDEKGKETILRPPPIERSAGVPGVIAIPPSEIIVIELELLRLIGERGLRPGTYKVVGFYDNKLKNDRTFIKDDVWVGRSATESVKITIIAPK